MLRLLVLAVLLCAGAQALSFVKPCDSGDRECLKQSAQAAVPVIARGLPELGVRSLDPMTIEQINDDQAGLKMNFRNSVVTGLKGCRVEYVKRDKPANKIKVALHCDVKVQGDYTLGGQLLILPIEGDGQYTIDVTDVRLKLSMDVVERAGADGKPHWHVSSWHHSYRGLGGAVFHFDNLFHGNKELSDAIHSFANTNWKDIMREVGSPIVKAVVGRIADATEEIFSKVPAEELALDFN